MENDKIIVELVTEIEQLIQHAEQDTLNYSVLEHARKLVFRITHPDKETDIAAQIEGARKFKNEYDGDEFEC